MNVSEALVKRKSTRYFLDKPVELSLIKEVLDKARHSPSGSNIQPWQVAVVTGKKKQSLDAKLVNVFRSGTEAQMEYQYYPEKWFAPYRARKFTCGFKLYDALDIARNDVDRRTEQWERNYTAFGAPVVLFFFIDRRLDTGSYMDYGMFLQSVMLMAMELGLSTCPQAALAEHPDIIREELNYPDEALLLCGMAMGYEDDQKPINQFRTDREETESFSQFFGFQ